MKLRVKVNQVDQFNQYNYILQQKSQKIHRYKFDKKSWSSHFADCFRLV